MPPHWLPTGWSLSRPAAQGAAPWDWFIFRNPAALVAMAVRSLWEGKEAPHAYLERLHLEDAHSFRDLFVRRLFAGNL